MKSTSYDYSLLVKRRYEELPPETLMEDCCTQETFKVISVKPTKKDTIKAKNEEAYPRSRCNDTDDDNLLRPYTAVLVWRTLPHATYIGKRLVTRYKAPKTTEYLDMSTGEIIQATNLRNDSRMPPQIHVGEIQMLRKALLDSLRKEVRDFAIFVLQFRNNRRGITPEIETLVDWYSRIHQKRASNVKRYVTTLHGVSFFAGQSLLSPLFQRTGKRIKSKDHLGEDAAARSTLLKIRLKEKSRLHLGSF